MTLGMDQKIIISRYAQIYYFLSSLCLIYIIQMHQGKPTLQLTPLHRVIVLILIILQYIIFAWAILLLVNYHAFRLPFLNYSSMITAETSQTHYLKNGALYILFWLQHILMATLKYKVSWYKMSKYFALYDRYVYNISSGLVLWYIFSNLQPSFIYLFTIPEWICLPISFLAVIMLMKAMIQLGGRIMMPFRLRQILNQRYLTYGSYQAKGLEGLKQSGIYAYVRNPMQGAVIILMLLGNGIYTTERVLYLFVMVGGVIVGVLMEEKRMMVLFKDYKSYMEKVKARFIPYIHLF